MVATYYKACVYWELKKTTIIQLRLSPETCQIHITKTAVTISSDARPGHVPNNRFDSEPWKWQSKSCWNIGPVSRTLSTSLFYCVASVYKMCSCGVCLLFALLSSSVLYHVPATVYGTSHFGNKQVYIGKIIEEQTAQHEKKSNLPFHIFYTVTVS